jgi:hypothetical protein
VIASGVPDALGIPFRPTERGLRNDVVVGFLAALILAIAFPVIHSRRIASQAGLKVGIAVEPIEKL